jgi:hypothetical protein
MQPKNAESPTGHPHACAVPADRVTSTADLDYCNSAAGSMLVQQLPHSLELLGGKGLLYSTPRNTEAPADSPAAAPVSGVPTTLLDHFPYTPSLNPEQQSPATPRSQFLDAMGAASETSSRPSQLHGTASDHSTSQQDGKHIHERAQLQNVAFASAPPKVSTSMPLGNVLSPTTGLPTSHEQMANDLSRRENWMGPA